MASNGGLCVPETPAIGVGLACGAGSSTHRCRLSLRSGFTRRGPHVRLEAARFRYASRRRGGVAARGARAAVPAAPAVKREAEEDWGKEKWR